MAKDHHSVTEPELLEKFLQFENEGKVLSYFYSYKNMLIWPFVRNAVWNAVYKSVYGNDTGLLDMTAQGMTRGRLRSYKWSQFFRLHRNPLFGCGHKDILYLYHVIGNIQDQEGVYYNRIYDDFVGLYDNTAIIESAPLFHHFYPKKYETYDADFIEILCAFHEKIAPLGKQDRETVHRFLAYLKKELPFAVKAQCWQTIRTETERYAKNMRLIYGYYKLVFQRIMPKIVFVAQGCDGSHMACKLKVLRDLGIPSAEIQHGLISRAHFAYNYAPTVCHSTIYKEYMPDFMMLFGTFWKDLVRMPVQLEVLGSANFNRNFHAESREEENIEDRNSVLILPSDLDRYMGLISYIHQELPEAKLYIKVHPTKKPQYDVLRKMENEQIRVYIKENIYDFLKRTKFVIGDDSTVLYEAAAMGKKVFIWKSVHSASFDRRIGIWFSDQREVVRLLQNNCADVEMKIAPEDIFARNSAERYRAFIAEYVQ